MVVPYFRHRDRPVRLVGHLPDQQGVVMKLAKLIAEEHYHGTDEVMARGMLENIVAAKLGPVRDAFAGLVGTAQRIAFEDAGLHNSDWQADPHDVLQLTLPEAIKALALFDDECDHEWVDARNEVVSSGEVCLKCHAVRAAPEEGS